MTHPEAFTAKQVSALTGLSLSVLRYWEETGVYRASFIDPRPRVPFRRLYTFRDLVSLRTLARLRRDYGLALRTLRVAGSYLSDTYPEMPNPWSALSFGVLGGRLVFRQPDTGAWLGVDPLQHPLLVDVEAIARTTADDARRLNARPATAIGQVRRDRNVLRNAWRVAGTRIPTATIWQLHTAGWDDTAIRREYPDLELADIEAAIAHERTINTKRVA